MKLEMAAWRASLKASSVAEGGGEDGEADDDGGEPGEAQPGFAESRGEGRVAEDDGRSWARG